jgi:hypothetical protein
MNIAPCPPPTSFAEGQRRLYGWLMSAAGVFCGAGFAGVILLLWLGGWSAASESQRLTSIALMGSGFPVGMIFVIVALSLGGPVGKFRAHVSKDGADVDAEAAQ